ncbi:hypothetical protein GCM10010191_09620 [Actinomadura vinacea]|uniref:Uncharacterized protein n=1 Tax=Actinomadura vinacea TaxID=115336 RepID=A0ABN3IG64_9ACTN
MLAERPEAMAEPEPLTLGELAERLSGPREVMMAFAACDLPSTQLAEGQSSIGQ